MSNPISPKITVLVFGVLIISFLAIFYTFAWTEPTLAPPSGNASTSVNIGPVAQYKVGALGVGGVLSAYATINMNNTRITNLPEPIANSDAANKAYVDAKIVGSSGGGGGSGSDFYQTIGTFDGRHASTACGADYHMCLMDEMSGHAYKASLGSDSLNKPSWINTNSSIDDMVIQMDGVAGCHLLTSDCYNWSATSTTGRSGLPFCYLESKTAYLNTAFINPPTGTPLWSYTSYAHCYESLPVLCCKNPTPDPEIDQTDRPADNVQNAIWTCRNLGSGWHLPSKEELTRYLNIPSASNEMLWTSTPEGSDGQYVVLRLKWGEWTRAQFGVTSYKFRCVR
jgi:hypothetical protein